jgi:hypothetical protein
MFAVVLTVLGVCLLPLALSFALHFVLLLLTMAGQLIAAIIKLIMWACRMPAPVTQSHSRERKP